jgi:hypothetical protein
MLKILIINMFMMVHPTHVTLTSINQEAGNDTLNVFFRMYYDDFLRDYKLYNPDFNPGKKPDVLTIPDDKLHEYFKDKVQIYINHKLLSGNLLAVSNDHIEICLSLAYQSDKDPKLFKIRNQIMTRLYSDQTNMVFISINKFEDALKLTSKHSVETRKLD